MTPQLQQAIRLLQLSRMELIDEIRKELDGNPVLADDEIDPRARSTGDGITGDAPTEAAGAIAGEERIQRLEDLERLKNTDTQTRNDEKKGQRDRLGAVHREPLAAAGAARRIAAASMICRPSSRI